MSDKSFGSSGVPAVVCCTAHLKVTAWNSTQIAEELTILINRNALGDMWTLPARLESFYLVPESPEVPR